jgi:hypothetical protein
MCGLLLIGFISTVIYMGLIMYIDWKNLRMTAKKLAENQLMLDDLEKDIKP